MQTKMLNRTIGLFILLGLICGLFQHCSGFINGGHVVFRRSFDHGLNFLRAEESKYSQSVSDKDEHYMRLALRHAQHSFREKEVPIGAVIVDSMGVILATSRNEVEGKKDVTAHAEISCIRKAAEMRNNWRLHDCTLYTTLEPCPMCMGAIQASRIKRVVYAAPDIRMGACGSWINLLEAKHPFHDVEVAGGMLQEESSILMKRFFQMRRREAVSVAAAMKNTSESNLEGSTNKKVGIAAELTAPPEQAHVDRGYGMKESLGA